MSTQQTVNDRANEKVQMVIGDLMVQVCTLQAALEDRTRAVAQLQAEVSEKTQEINRLTAPQHA